MRRIILLSTIILVICGLVGCESKEIIAGRIVNSVVKVNRSSGVLVYSDNDMALILTSYHVIDDDLDEVMCSNCYYPTKISIENGSKEKFYDVLHISFTMKHDLAIIKIKVDHKLPYVKVGRSRTYVGEDIYTCSNPQMLFRSFKHGVIGSKGRIVDDVPATEIGGGIIFGSSGGGVFSTNGKLIGIIKAVRELNTRFCYFVPNVGPRCLLVPIPYLGFSAPRIIIVAFLTQGPFGEKFNYLR